jgi:hypothetical protein
VDPDSNTDSDPAFQVNPDPDTDLIRIQGLVTKNVNLVSAQCCGFGFECGFGPSISSESGSGYGSNPDPGFGDQKLKKKNTAKKLFVFFISKILIYLSLDLLKDVQATGEWRSLHPSKENIQHFKKLNFIIKIFIGVGHFCPPGYGFRDPIESGSTKLFQNKRGIVPFQRCYPTMPNITIDKCFAKKKREV